MNILPAGPRSCYLGVHFSGGTSEGPGLGTLSFSWVEPGRDLAPAISDQRARLNWAAAADEFLRWGHRAGIFRIYGSGYQFRHRELQEWFLRAVDPWLGWSGELSLARSMSQYREHSHQVHLFHFTRGRDAAQLMLGDRLLAKVHRERIDLAQAVIWTSSQIRPDSLLHRFTLAGLKVLISAEQAARTSGSASIHPRHILCGAIDQLGPTHPDLPVSVSDVGTVIRSRRTVPGDVSLGYLPLSKATRRMILVGQGCQRIAPFDLLVLVLGDEECQQILQLIAPGHRLNVWVDGHGGAHRSSADQQMASAVTAADQNQPDTALRRILSAVSDHRPDPTLAEMTTLVSYGRSLILKSGSDPGWHLYGALTSAFALTSLWSDLGQRLWADGRPAEALKALRRAENDDPDDATAVLGQARILIVQGALDRARTKLDQAKRLWPDNPEILAEVDELETMKGLP